MAVGDLCERLDGIPLAIELAAARSRSLRPSELLARLDDRFRLLRDDRRDIPARHRTLRAAVEWSHSVLDGSEQALFDRLAVFSGGFDLDAAEAIGVDLDLDVIDRLDHLVARSLVVAEDHDGTTRFRLLQTLRAFALEHLERDGLHDGLEARHAAWYLGRVVELASGLRGEAREQAVARIDADLDNLRAAVGWASRRDPAAALAAIGGLWPYFTERTLVLEAYQWLLAIAAHDDALDDAERARLCERLGDATFQSGVDLTQGIEWLQDALAIHVAAGDAARAVRVHSRLARNLSSFPELMDIDQAMAHAREAHLLLPDDADIRSLIDLHTNSATIALYARRNGEGVEASRRLMELTDGLGLPRPRIYALAQLGTHVAYAGDLDQGFELLAQSWREAQQEGDAFARFLAVWRRGFGAVLAHDPDDALVWFEREQAAERSEHSPLRLRTMATMVALARLLRGETRPALLVPVDEADNGPVFEPLLALCTAEGDRVESVMAAAADQSYRKGNLNDWLQIALLWGRYRELVGDRDRAFRILDEALAGATAEVPSPYYELPVRARLALLGDQPEVHLARCAEVLAGGHFRGLVGLVQVADAQVAARRGLPADEVDERFTAALGSLRAYSLRWEEGAALARWSGALEAQERGADAAVRASQAIGVFEAIGAPSHWRELVPRSLR